LDGRNATLFAYGATGSGKTHSIIGNPDAPGMIPRVMHQLFSEIERRSDTLFSVQMSYVQLYNNIFEDLLHRKDPTKTPLPYEKAPRITIRESRGDGVFLVGSETLNIPVPHAAAAIKLLHRGNSARTVCATMLNANSSRSHAILCFNIQSRVNGGKLKKSKLYIIDLAGSEQVTLSGVEGQAMVETQSINLSLTALANCLSMLSRPKADLWLVPYRNNKLTHLLRDSLGGNAKTMMLSHVHSDGEQYRQTLQTLKYSATAKSITCTPVAEELISTTVDGSVSEKQQQIRELQAVITARTMELEDAGRQQQRATSENKDLYERVGSLTQQQQNLLLQLGKLREEHELEQAQLQIQLREQEHLTDPHMFDNLTTVMTKLEECELEKGTLQQKLETFQKLEGDLQSQLVDVQQEAEQTTMQLETKLHEAQQEAEQTTMQLETKLHEATICNNGSALNQQNDFAMLQSTCLEQKTQLMNLKLELVARNDEVDELTGSLEVSQTQIQQLQTKQQALLERVEQAADFEERHQAQLHEKAVKLHTNVTSISQRCETLEKLEEDHLKMRNFLAKSKAAVEASLEKSDADNSQLKQQVSDITRECEHLRQLKTAALSTEGCVQNLHDEISQLKEQARVLESQAALAEATGVTKNEGIADLEQTVARLQHQLEESKKEVQSSMAQQQGDQNVQVADNFTPTDDGDSILDDVAGVEGQTGVDDEMVEHADNTDVVESTADSDAVLHNDQRAMGQPIATTGLYNDVQTQVAIAAEESTTSQPDETQQWTTTTRRSSRAKRVNYSDAGERAKKTKVHHQPQEIACQPDLCLEEQEVQQEVPEEASCGEQEVQQEVPEEASCGEQEVQQEVPEEASCGEQEVQQEVPEKPSRPVRRSHRAKRVDYSELDDPALKPAKQPTRAPLTPIRQNKPADIVSGKKKKLYKAKKGTFDERAADTKVS
jgi:hypothetical protein